MAGTATMRGDDLNGAVERIGRAAYDRLRPLPLHMVGRPSPDAGWCGVVGWYVLACGGRREAQVYEALAGMGGVEPFLPLRRVQVCRGRGARKAKVWESHPYFPGYLFVQCAMGSALLRDLRNLDGVIDVLCSHETGHPLPDRAGVVERLRAAQAGGFLDAQVAEEAARLRKGEIVRAVDGPMAGQQGPVDRLDKRDGVWVLLRIMGSAVPVRFKTADVERTVEG